MTFTVETLPSNGQLLDGATPVAVGTTYTGTKTLTYAPNANWNGTDTFTYTASDGSIDGLPATVTINVASVNDAPAGANNTVTTAEDTAYIFTAADFGFSDPNDSPANALRLRSLPAVEALPQKELP